MNGADIYRETLLDIIKNPPNRGVLADSSAEAEERNPLCGDVIRVQIKIDGGFIKDAAFESDACAVCIASASLLIDEVKGKTTAFAKNFTKEELLNIIGINLTISRVKCAALALYALRGAIEKYEREGFVK